MIKTFGVSQRLVVTIPNAVDSRRLRPERGREETRRLLGIPESHRVVLSLGALTWEKDPLTLIEVSARMCLDRNDFTHVFVGDGPMRGQVERAVTERALDGRVLLLGNRSDVGDLLSASDVVLFASRADGMEGMPAALIEAGMMARPVVAYAVAGVPEVVEDGTTGALVVPGDVDGLTERTIRLLEDQQMREAMGSAAQLRCASLFDIRAVAPQYLGLYRELAGAR
jgi:glycosyltransferase involved in cell wall biosynthesis